jgi:RNA polymerase sigma-54 factor
MLKLSASLQTKQSLVFNAQLQQALHVLQLPIIELAQWLEMQIEQTPKRLHLEASTEEITEELDFEIRDFTILNHLDDSFIQGAFPEEFPTDPTPIENTPAASVSLYEHLMHQARMNFSTPEDLKCAEHIIGNINDKGFLEDINSDPTILRTIQTFDPLGVGAKNLQESLLIQLRFFKKESSLIYAIIENYFEDLIKLKLSFVARKIKMTPQQLKTFLKKETSFLNFHPTNSFRNITSPSITPDIIIKQQSEKWIVLINDSPLAPFYTQIQWIKKIIERRNSILQQIGNYLLQKHKPFFTKASLSIIPCSITETSKALELHPSTISRAIKKKYIHCPNGVLPLRVFFPHTSAALNKGPSISHLDAKRVLHKLIKTENKQKPLSDQNLATLMNREGIPCMRRTVAKYRQKLNIPASFLRH